MRRGWEARLRTELRAIIKHLEAADRRVIQLQDIDTFDWDWWARYGTEVERELISVYRSGLAAEGFIETPLMPTHQLAVNYARRRAGEMLKLTDRDSIVDFTRARVRRLVAETIESGDSLRELKNKLRQDFGFSDSRADMVARTETATANTNASLKSYQSLGYEGKEWLTAQDERVDAGDFSGPCVQNEQMGQMALGRMFDSGHDGPPAHPRCRCTLMPVRELPKRQTKTVTKKIERDEERRMVGVTEETVEEVGNARG